MSSQSCNAAVQWPPTVPPVCKGWFPRRRVDLGVCTNHENIQLVGTARNAVNWGSSRRPAAVQLPPTVPPICKCWFPCRRIHHSILVSHENVKLVCAARYCAHL